MVGWWGHKVLHGYILEKLNKSKHWYVKCATNAGYMYDTNTALSARSLYFLSGPSVHSGGWLSTPLPQVLSLPSWSSGCHHLLPRPPMVSTSKGPPPNLTDSERKKKRISLFEGHNEPFQPSEIRAEGWKTVSGPRQHFDLISHFDSRKGEVPLS